nr:hypothetical protein [Candidatus Sigynarchaeota archaeon]
MPSHHQSDPNESWCKLIIAGIFACAGGLFLSTLYKYVAEYFNSTSAATWINLDIILAFASAAWMVRKLWIKKHDGLRLLFYGFIMAIAHVALSWLLVSVDIAFLILFGATVTLGILLVVRFFKNGGFKASSRDRIGRKNQQAALSIKQLLAEGGQ